MTMPWLQPMWAQWERFYWGFLNLKIAPLLDNQCGSTALATCNSSWSSSQLRVPPACQRGPYTWFTLQHSFHSRIFCFVPLKSRMMHATVKIRSFNLQLYTRGMETSMHRQCCSSKQFQLLHWNQPQSLPALKLRNHVLRQITVLPRC